MSRSRCRYRPPATPASRRGRGRSIRPVSFLTLLVALLPALGWVARESQGGEPPVVRGPYLQRATPTGMTVKWRTSSALVSAVWYGTEPGAFTDSLFVGPPRTDHAVRLEGLVPGARYYYALGSSSGRFPDDPGDRSFRTAPPPGSEEPVRIWIVGDSGFAGSVQEQIQDAFFARSGGAHPDVWLLLGDNAYDAGTDAEYQVSFFGPFSRMLGGVPAWSTRGNHDVLYAGSNNDYYDFFEFPVSGEAGGTPSATEAYYSFDHGDVHFVCLDSEGSDRTPGSPMLLWLEQDLAATDREWKIAFWHHAPYTHGSHDSDTEYRPTQMRENVLPILEAHGVDLVLAGHSHGYERSFLLDGHYGRSWELEPWMILDSSLHGPYAKPSGGAPHAGALYVVAGMGSIVYPGDYDHPAMAVGMMQLGSVLCDIDGLEARVVFLDENGNPRDQIRLIKLPPSSAGDAVGEGPSGRVALSLTTTPNPSSGEIRIDLRLPLGGPVEIALFDAQGRRVRRVHEGPLGPGRHLFRWDGRGQDGPVPNGVYLVRARTGLGELAVKVLLRRS